MIRFETSVRIERPIEDVWGYMSDPGNLPAWNSAVRSVRRTAAGSGYTMERSLPNGPAVNELEVVRSRCPDVFTIHTTSGPTPFVYRFRLSPRGDATVVDLDAEAEVGGAGRLLAPVTQHLVRRGVDDNLATLKERLETRR